MFPSPGFCYADNLSKDKPLSDYFKLPNETLFKPRWDIFKPLIPTVPWSAAVFWALTVLSAARIFIKRKILNRNEKLVFSSLVVFFLTYSAINMLSGVIEIRYLTPVHAAQLLMVLGALLTIPQLKTKIKE
jgi:hypothetical protein